MPKSGFEPITLRWNDAEYVIPAGSVMEAIARIEEHVTLEDVNSALQKQGLKRVVIARAFASVLRFAGAKVSDEEIYKGMFDLTKANAVIPALVTLMAMMVPPGVIRDAVTAEGKKKVTAKPNRRMRRRAAAEKAATPTPENS